MKSNADNGQIWHFNEKSKIIESSMDKSSVDPAWKHTLNRLDKLLGSIIMASTFV
jgi:hypothetical protein